MFVSMILDIQRIVLISRLSRIWKSCFRNHDVWKILWYLKRSFGCNMIEYNMAKVMFSYLMKICKKLETLVVLIFQKVLERNIILAIHRYKLKVAWSWINPWWGWIFDVASMANNQHVHHIYYMTHALPFGDPCSETMSVHARLVKIKP